MGPEQGPVFDAEGRHVDEAEAWRADRAEEPDPADVELIEEAEQPHQSALEEAVPPEPEISPGEQKVLDEEAARLQRVLDEEQRRYPKP